MSEDNMLKELEKSFDGDTDLLLFYVAWLKNNMNASAAYKELHPNVTEGSAWVLGGRRLSKVKEKIGLVDILSAYGLTLSSYIGQLREGNMAEKRDQFSGEMYPDHQTRLKYHDKLGKLLGIESDQGNQVNVQVNNYIPLLGGDSQKNVSTNDGHEQDTTSDQEN